MFFDDPHIKKMMDDDDKILRFEKINWTDSIISLAKSLSEVLRISAMPNDYFDTDAKLKDNPNVLRRGTKEHWQKQLKFIQSKFLNTLKEFDNPDPQKVMDLAEKISDLRSKIERAESIINRSPEEEQRIIREWEAWSEDGKVPKDILESFYNEQFPNLEKLKSELEIAEKELEKELKVYFSPRNDQIKSLVSLMKNWDRNEACSFSWKDTALSILKNPLSVVFDYDTCPKCGKKRIKLHFSSPSWTWALLCGRAGDMVVCLECKSQVFKCTIMN